MSSFDNRAFRTIRGASGRRSQIRVLDISIGQNSMPADQRLRREEPAGSGRIIREVSHEAHAVLGRILSCREPAQNPEPESHRTSAFGVDRRVSAPSSGFDIPLLSITLPLISGATYILDRLEQGDPKAAEELLPLVYDELRRLAAAKLAGEAPGQTLQATALVHEAWLRIANQDQQQFTGRAHFFAAAAEAMRRILVDRARRKRAAKHGGGLTPVDIGLVELPIESDPDRLLRVHEVLDKLAAEEPVRAEIVKLRFFVGMNHNEIAQALHVSEKTVKRYWAYAKAWLQRALENSPG